MSPTLRNILAIVGGIIIGGLVNMGIIMLGSAIVAPPAGVDPSDMESIKANIHLYQPIHFLIPFLAHALGTLVGAFVAAKFSVTHKMRSALIIGVFFLAGGIASVFMIPAPVWFIALDLILAYIPAAWLGRKLAQNFSSKAA